MPPHRLIFAVAPSPLSIFVTFISRDVDDGFDGTSLPGSFQHMHGAHDIGRIGLYRLLIGKAHQRLRCHMDEDLRLECEHLRLHSGKIADITNAVLHTFRNASHMK